MTIISLITLLLTSFLLLIVTTKDSHKIVRYILLILPISLLFIIAVSSINFLEINLNEVTAISSNFILLDIDEINSQLITSILGLSMILQIAIYYATITHEDNLELFTLLSIITYIAGVLLILSSTFVELLISYEILTALTVWLVVLAGKTQKIVDALKNLIVWSQLGALLLVGVILYITDDIAMVGEFTVEVSYMESSIIAIILIIMFGVKIPIWPMCWWLNDVHVEVGTHYSIVLSGISIKFALLTFIQIYDLFSTTISNSILIVLTVIGANALGERSTMINDLKEAVAIFTLSEVNNAIALFILGTDNIFTINNFVVTHAFLSALNFIAIDILSRRYHTRNINDLRGVGLYSPLHLRLLYFFIMVFSGLPISSVFDNEINTASILSDFDIFGCIFANFFFGTTSILRNVWQTIFTGHRKMPKKIFTISKLELYILIYIILMMTIWALFTIIL